MLASEGKGVGKTEFTKKLLKSRLIVPPPKYVVWCYAENQQDLFEELLKMIVESITGELDNYFKKRKINNVEYVEGIPGELDNYFKKNKINLIILYDLKDEASKRLKVTQLFTRGRH